MEEFDQLVASHAALGELYAALRAAADHAASSLRAGSAHSAAVDSAEADLSRTLDTGWQRIEAAADELLRALRDDGSAAKGFASSLAMAISEHQTGVALSQARLDEATELASSTDWSTPFHAALSKVQEAVERACGAKAPWELEYHLVRSKEDEDDGMVSFVGGAIVDAEGRPLWLSKCALSGRVIQHGSKGSGEPRFFSLERDADLSPSAHALVERLRLAINAAVAGGKPEARAVDTLLMGGREGPETAAAAPLPYLHDRFSEERDVPVFLRLGVRLSPSDAGGVRTGLNDALRIYAPRPLFATVDGEPEATPESRLPWRTYADVHTTVQRVAHVLASYDWPDATADGSGESGRGRRAERFVGLLVRRSCAEFYVADFAAAIARCATVAMHSNWSAAQLGFCLRQTRLRVLFCSGALLPLVLDGAAESGTSFLRHVVLIDEPEPATDAVAPLAAPGSGSRPGQSLDERAQALSACLVPSLAAFTELRPLEPRSATDLAHAPAPGPSDDFAPDEIVMLMYTSGSTGDPKAVCVTAASLLADVGAATFLRPLVLCSRTPASLAADRLATWGAVLSGGRICFAPIHLDALSCIEQARPTVLSAPPIFWHTLHNESAQAVAAALAQADDGGSALARERAEAAALASFKRRLGGRLLQIGTGGAATSPGVLSWMGRLSGEVCDSFGATEVGLIATNGVLDSKVDVKLLPYVSDGASFTPDDQPYPRGELLVRTPAITPGYYGDEARTSAAFDADGWYHTGDLVALEPGRRVTVIGRCSEMLKLSNGLFVAPRRLEAIFAEADAVAHIFVHGSARHAVVVAVVVPVSDRIDAATVADQLRVSASLHGLAAHEVPARLLLERAGTSWTVEGGLLTHSGKLQRSGLLSRYGERLATLLSDATAAVDAQGGPLGAPPDRTTGGVEEWVMELARSLVGANAAASLPTIDECRGCSFAELGGTSTSAIRFQMRLRDRLPWLAGVSAARLLHQPLGDVARLAATLDAPSRALADAWTSQEDEATWAEMDAACTLPSDLAAGAITAADGCSSRDARLLTGGTGFVGAHVLGELILQRTARAEDTSRGSSAHAPVWWCPVRARDDAEAASRLRAALDKYGLASAAEGGLPPWVRPVATADLAAARMGLDSERYAQIVGSTSVVLHLAARVTFWETFSRCAASNVGATIEVLRFCRRARATLHHGSTLSVFGSWSTDGGGDGRALDESSSIGADARHSGVAHADGYSQSKWVAERLVLAAAREEGVGLRAHVHRLGFISFAARTGASNPADWLTRILSGAMRVGSWPDGGCELHLAPVDWTARALLALTERPLDSSAADRTSTSTPAVTHLCSPTPVPLAQLVGFAGTPMQPVPLDVFCASVQADGEANPAFALLPVLRAGLPKRMAVSPPAGTERALRTAGPGAEPHAPPVTEVSVRRHFAWLVATADVSS